MKKHDKRMVLAIASMLALATTVFAGQPQSDPQKQPQKAQPRTDVNRQDKKNQKPAATGDRLEPDDTPRATDMPDDVVANRQERLSEEEAVNPY